MNQQKLPLVTEFEEVTAQQLAWCKGKDEPSEVEIAEAVKMASRWNKKRIAMGLRAWV